MADEIIIETVSAEVIEVGVVGPQGPKGDPGDVAGLPLTTQGDTLYRGASQNERLPVGTAGQVLKVINGLPAWANESGAVSSVNGETGAVVLDGSEIDTSGNTDSAAFITSEFDDGNGLYYPLRDTTLNNKRVYRNTTGHHVFFENLRWHITDGSPVTANIVESSDNDNAAWPWLSAWSGDVTKAKLSDVVGRARDTFLFVGDSIPNTSVSGLTAAAAAAAPVQSVAGRTGAVTLAVADVSNAVSTSRTISAGTGLSGGGDLTANRTLSVSFGSSAGTACEGNDARLSDSRNPTLHAASHAASGSDPLAPSDIGAQSVFSTQSLVLTADETLTASRAKNYALQNYGSGPFNLTLPIANNLAGDIVVVRNFGTFVSDVVIRQQMHDGTSGGPQFITLSTIVGAAGGNPPSQQYRFIKGNSSNYGGWSLVPVDTHTHAPSEVGLGNVSNTAQVTSVSGTAPIVSSGGTTPTISINAATTSAAGSMSSADKTKLDGIAAGAEVNVQANWTESNSASDAFILNKPTLAAIATSGSASDLTSGTVATARLGTGTADNTTFLRGDGSWATPAGGGGGGVSAIGASAADILSVSGSDLVADDPNADRIVFWDDSASKLTHLEVGSGLSISGTTLTATGGGGGGTKTYAVFTAEHNQPPVTSFATLDTRNSIAVLDFSDTATESAVFVGVMPEAAVLTSGLIVRLYWMGTATTGDVRWSVAFERGNTDLDADSFDTATAATATTNATSGIVTVTSITCTNIDGITAGDLFRLRVQRLGADAADTMAGAKGCELVAVEVRSAA